MAYQDLEVLHMDDGQANPGALVAHYVPVTCQVPALDWNLGYTYVEHVGHFLGMVVSGVMRCYRRLEACRQKKISDQTLHLQRSAVY